MCSFGAAPGVLTILSPKTSAGPMPAATIMDFQPFVNIGPFSLCSSLANPAVASATAAALGVLTPMPCTPMPIGPWQPGSPTVHVEGKPALTNLSTCQCAYGGVITISVPGQGTVTAS